MYVPALQIFGMDLHCVVGDGVGASRGRDVGSSAFESKIPVQRLGQCNLRSRMHALRAGKKSIIFRADITARSNEYPKCSHDYWFPSFFVK